MKCRLWQYLKKKNVFHNLFIITKKFTEKNYSKNIKKNLKLNVTVEFDEFQFRFSAAVWVVARMFRTTYKKEGVTRHLS